MNFYINTKCVGHYPVGFCALAMAGNAEEAANLLNVKLKADGLEETAKACDMDLFEISGQPRAVILFNGDY